jgi:nitrogen fixation NifU-like protein
MSEESFDFWRDHSRNYLEMAFRRDRRETVSNPDGQGQKTGDCGDTIAFFLTVVRGRIERVSFDTDGCLNTNACANAVAQLAEGEPVAQAWEITPETVIDFLQTLPADSEHCAELAVGAFYLALADYDQLQRQPWKKLYR